MTSAHTNPVITLSDEPSYSAQDAAAVLGSSFSWLDQRLRNEQTGAVAHSRGNPTTWRVASFSGTTAPSTPGGVCR